MPRVILPNNWKPRLYQLPAWSYLERGGLRAALAWHRRAGKDEIALHWTAVSSHLRIGNFWHMLPQQSQARKAIWKAVNPHTGKRRIDEAFPKAIRKSTNDTEMFIEFRNGSTWQVVGSDNYHSLVGAPPIGVIFSEYSRADPGAWAYLRPILLENGGWSVFISTFFGRNHMWALTQSAKKWPDWFTETLSAEDTKIFSAEQLEHERQEYVADYGEEEGDALFRQEYLSDPSASVLGSYFGPQVAAAEKDGRITKVPYERSRPVFTGWDLGSNDITAIWFAQMVGYQPRIIDYYQANNQDTAHYYKVLKEKGYAYGSHFLPHDGGNKRVLKNSILDELREMGLRNVYATRRAQDSDELIADINTARKLIVKAVFDEEKCERGLDALRNYRRDWDDELKQYKKTPRHDWASDGADAFRTLAVNWTAIEAESSGVYSSGAGFREMSVA